MSFDEPVDPMHKLTDARSEGVAFRDSVLLLQENLDHLGRQFLLFSAVLFGLLGAVLVLSADRSAPDAFREWIPGLCIVLAFGACAFLVQFLKIRQLQGGASVVLRGIGRALDDSHVVVEQK